MKGVASSASSSASSSSFPRDANSDRNHSDIKRKKKVFLPFCFCRRSFFYYFFLSLKVADSTDFSFGKQKLAQNKPPTPKPPVDPRGPPVDPPWGPRGPLWTPVDQPQPSIIIHVTIIIIMTIIWMMMMIKITTCCYNRDRNYGYCNCYYDNEYYVVGCYYLDHFDIFLVIIMIIDCMY